ncbi:hypothetical protein ABKV19_012051 [Rosa sericea]
MVGSSVRLKSLVVRDCWNLEIIEICDLPQLAFFRYEGTPICLDLNRVRNLVKVSLGEDDLEFLKLALKQLACCLCQLRTLTLDSTLTFLPEENVVFPIPQLPELEYLELRIEADDACVLLQLASFLDASPRLQKLLIKGDFLGSEVKLLKAESRPHNNLKLAEVVGFNDCPAATDSHMKMLLYMLQKVVIDTVLPWCEL